MTNEDQHTDRKSLRLVIGKTADWYAIACDCVCFANGAGGRMLIGIEDGGTEPPPAQVIPGDLPERLRKRIGELTVNVQALRSGRPTAANSLSSRSRVRQTLRRPRTDATTCAWLTNASRSSVMMC
jgi:hypothetical protein